jgi:hypothetical protein
MGVTNRTWYGRCGGRLDNRFDAAFAKKRTERPRHGALMGLAPAAIHSRSVFRWHLLRPHRGLCSRRCTPTRPDIYPSSPSTRCKQKSRCSPYETSCCIVLALSNSGLPICSEREPRCTAYVLYGRPRCPRAATSCLSGFSPIASTRRREQPRKVFAGPKGIQPGAITPSNFAALCSYLPSSDRGGC